MPPLNQTAGALKRQRYGTIIHLVSEKNENISLAIWRELDDKVMFTLVC